MRKFLILLLVVVESAYCTVPPVLEPAVYRERISLEGGIDMVFEGIEGPMSEGSPPLQSGVATRRGAPTRTHSCNHVRGVPANLRSPSEMKPYGVTQFYQKYTEAYNIPVLASSRVPDDALRRACYVLRFLFADHSGVRREYYRRHGRVAMVAASEGITEIPEYSHLDPTFWNARARGLGATDQYPICTGAEENILCYSQDRYPRQDICLHEYAHGVHALGAKYAISGWDTKLSYWYETRKSQGLWRNTYSMSTYMEYFAEGVQSWFNVNREANPPDGINNHVNTREELRQYDIELYNLIAVVFPCNNKFIKRCEKNRAKEMAQKLLMDCNEGDGEREEDDEDDDDDGDDGDDTNPDPEECVDTDENCRPWKNAGYCTGTHQEYMSANCPVSCGTCLDDGDDDEITSCDDKDTTANCNYWASAGYCTGTYEEWMSEMCMKSCDLCPEEETEEEVLPPIQCYDRDPKKCKKRAKKGHCTDPRKSNYMKKNCEKSCKFC